MLDVSIWNSFRLNGICCSVTRLLLVIGSALPSLKLSTLPSEFLATSLVPQRLLMHTSVSGMSSPCTCCADFVSGEIVRFDTIACNSIAKRTAVPAPPTLKPSSPESLAVADMPPLTLPPLALPFAVEGTQRKYSLVAWAQNERGQLHHRVDAAYIARAEFRRLEAAGTPRARSESHQHIAAQDDCALGQNDSATVVTRVADREEDASRSVLVHIVNTCGSDLQRVRHAFNYWNQVAKSKFKVGSRRFLAPRPDGGPSYGLTQFHWHSPNWEWLQIEAGPMPPGTSWAWMFSWPKLWPHAQTQYDTLADNAFPTKRLRLRLYVADLLRVADSSTPQCLAQCFKSRMSRTACFVAWAGERRRGPTALGRSWDAKRPLR